MPSKLLVHTGVDKEFVYVTTDADGYSELDPFLRANNFAVISKYDDVAEGLGRCAWSRTLGSFSNLITHKRSKYPQDATLARVEEDIAVYRTPPRVTPAVAI